MQAESTQISGEYFWELHSSCPQSIKGKFKEILEEINQLFKKKGKNIKNQSAWLCTWIETDFILKESAKHLEST